MHVVHCITRLILGGAQENTLLTVIEQVQTYGDQVVLITGPPLGPEGSLIEAADEAGIDVRIIPELRRNVHPVLDWKSLKSIECMLRDEKPQLIHTHSSKAGVLGRIAASKLKIPAVHTVHGAAFHRNQPGWMRTLFRRAEKHVAPNTARWISVCDAMTDQYVEAGVDDRRKFVTIYSGMDVEPFLNPANARMRIRKALDIRESDIVVGKIARLFHLKGHDDLISAAEKLLQEHGNADRVKFLLVGDGILREQLQDRISQLGIGPSFRFAGLVPNTEVPDYIHAMDLVVHTSLREGLARVLPQALISGRPVISYDVDGAREVAIEGKTGFLLKPGDVDGLVASMQQLVSDPDLRSRWGQTGRELFTDRFRYQTMVREIRKVYGEVLDEISSSGPVAGVDAE